ncbi:MAG: hypothetical protein IJY18_01530 [Clostridia bacterium]|nr:hypothetical protein [Clostridia bacterium]
MGAFFKSVIDGTFDFKAIGAAVSGFKDSFFANETVAGLWEKATGLFASLGTIFPLILIALSLIELFFGKKLIGLQRFLLCAISGYAIGVIIVSPLINQVFALPDYISGAVIALVMAVLCKYVYFAAVAVASGYSVYLVLFNGMIPVIPVKGNLIVSAAAAAVAILLVFLLLKYVEMAGTSFLGAFFISRIVIKYFYDYRTFGFIQNYAKIVDIALIAVVALIGFIVQVKTRKRY